MKLLRIKHEVPQIEEKINFFYGYKDFIVDYIGKAPYLPLDTPVSILVKILHQFEFNAKNRRERFIYNHIDNLNFYNDIMSFMYSEKYHKIKYEHQKYKNKEENDLESEVNVFIKDIKDDFEKDLLNTINYFFDSRYSLNRTKKVIKKMAIIFVSHFMLKGYSKKDIKELVIRSYGLEKSIPKEIEDNKKYFIFKIRNCTTAINNRDTLSINYRDVEFVTPVSKKLEVIREISKSKNYKLWRRETSAYELFFSDEDTVLAIVETSSLSSDSGFEAARSKLRIALNYFKMIYKNEFIDVDFYYFSTDDLSSAKPTFHHKTSYETTVLKQEDILSILNTEKSQDVQKKMQEILDFESLYTSARLETSLSKYWQYLECLLPKKIDPNGKERLQVRKLFKKIMQKERKRLRDIISSYILITIPPLGLNNSSYIFKKFSSSQAIEFYNNLHKKLAFYGVCKFLPELKIESIKEIIRDLKNEFKRTKSEQWEDYYESLILELYEYRNSDVHKGRNNEYLERKLKLLMPSLMSTFRWSWRFFYLENSPNENGEYDFTNMR